jgi:hypothetical protein
MNADESKGQGTTDEPAYRQGGTDKHRRGQKQELEQKKEQEAPQ